MQKILLGTIGGLLIGAAGAMAYDHYLGDGKLLADLQSQLDDAKTKLAASLADKKLLAQKSADEDAQLTQVQSSNEELRKQVQARGDTPATPPPVAAAPDFNPGIVGAIMGMMRGGAAGFRMPEQRLFLMQTRLKLTPDQAKTIKAAMDADNQARRDAFRQMRQNGKMDAQALAAANTLDKTLATVLSPAQQTAYQQLQADEKASRAETLATQQVDQMLPLLQLNDQQKEQAMNAIYQQQLSAPDAMGIMANPNPMNAIANQAQSTQSALQKVLSTDQYKLYQQDQQVQAQAFAAFGGRRNGGNAAGGNGGTASAPAAPTPVPAPAPAATPSVSASPDASTSAGTTATPATGTTPPATNGTSSADAPPPPPPNGA